MDRLEKLITIVEPSFYKSFACTGNECPTNCCHSWKIRWEDDEVKKLKSAECSESLRKIIDNSFIQEENVFFILFNNRNKCSMLDENNLCRIQKELGVEYMSRTCMDYPRIMCQYDEWYRTCELSCNRVVEILCTDPDAMRLEKNNKVVDMKTKAHFDEQKDCINHPQLRYRNILFDFFWNILLDESRSIETSIVLCSLAAQKLDEFIKKRQDDRIPHVINALKLQLNNPAQIKKLENAKPNLSLKMNFAAALIRSLDATKAYSLVIGETGIPDENICREGVRKFDEIFKNKPYAIKNIVLNAFLALYMPYRDIDSSLFDNLRYFAAEISAIKFIGAVMSARVVDSDIEGAFYCSVSRIDRSFAHNVSKIKKVYDMLDTFGITSPAYLMGILK